VWKEIQSGREWIVDADLKDFFGSLDHEKLLTLVAHPRTTAGFTPWLLGRLSFAVLGPLALNHHALYPVPVRRLAALLHASFSDCLAAHHLALR
jgi:hypothetical protein